METWEQEILEEIERELQKENPLVKQGVVLTEFVSKSRGHNRAPRKQWREVILVTYRGKTLAVGNRLTKKMEFLLQAVYPEKTAIGDDWLIEFLTELRTINNHLTK